VVPAVPAVLAEALDQQGFQAGESPPRMTPAGVAAARDARSRASNAVRESLESMAESSVWWLSFAVTDTLPQRCEVTWIVIDLTIE
jgi:hypothetical protein